MFISGNRSDLTKDVNDNKRVCQERNQRSILRLPKVDRYVISTCLYQFAQNLVDISTCFQPTQLKSTFI